MSSGIVLTSSVRANLSTLQTTAALLATTQTRLATGKKVNSALDNPTNFFTAANLDARASDLRNLLDGVDNAVSVLNQANNGLTTLNALVDSAKSIANQALAAQPAFSTKSNVSATITGATAADLRGTSTFTNATATGNVLVDGTAGGTHAATGTTKLGGLAGSFSASAAVNGLDTNPITAATKLYGAAASDSLVNGAAANNFSDGTVLTVNGHTITFKAQALPTAGTVPAGFGLSNTAGSQVATDGNGNSIVYLGTNAATTSASVGDVLEAVDLASGVRNAVVSAGVATVTTDASQTASSIAAGVITLRSSTGADLTLTGKADALKELKLTASTGSGGATIVANRTVDATTLGTLVQDGSTLNVNGHTITFKNGIAPASANVPAGSGVLGNIVNDGNGNSTVYLNKGTLADVETAIDLATGVQKATNSVLGVASYTTSAGSTNSSIAASGALQISTGTTADLSILGTGNAFAAFGLNGNTGTSSTFSATRASAAGGLSGKTLTFTAFSGGTATNITFGDGTNGTVKSLDQLNAALASNNLQAAVDSTGKLTISTTNDFASATLGGAAGGVLGGTITGTLAFTAATAPVADATGLALRNGLIAQYNNVIAKINTTAQDAGINGINLLNGDQLKVTFDETGKSVQNIVGVTFNAAGLGLQNLTVGTDFLDNNSSSKVLTALNSASSLLRSTASSFGSNLSVVQISEQFTKSVINTLQTTSDNLTLADTNEEAANSQALSTRQSIAVSALALANRTNQTPLQLLQG